MKKKKKNNDNNKTIIAIVAVALLIALVGGGTYAYWSWRSNNNTAVSFTVSGGTMTIDGGGNIT
ncbi:MAG: SipW-dependent-type signal peptide-containing protein, partial [Bacilli bacterium]|nr:SipW-dependent-type signal peptide-containing protein [Bacilli bacterium]